MWKAGSNPRHAKYVISCWFNFESHTEECENKDTEKDVPIVLGQGCSKLSLGRCECSVNDRVKGWKCTSVFC